MIFLFNSGFRPLYATDVLQALALPTGALVQHRYKVAHVDPELEAVLEARRTRWKWPFHFERERVKRACGKLPVVGRLAPAGTPVAFVFVDRYATINSRPAYMYYPYRLGLLYEHWRNDNRVYARVRLGELFASTLEQEAITERIGRAVHGKHPPTIVGADPDNTGDGHYEMEGRDVLSDCPGRVYGDEAWALTAARLSATKCFESTPSKTVVFLRWSIDSEGRRGGRDEFPNGSPVGRALLKRDTLYECRIHYRCVAPSGVPWPRGTIALENGDSLQRLGTAETPITAEADEVTWSVGTKKYGEDGNSYLAINVSASGQSGGVLLAPRLHVPVKLREPKSYWLKAAALCVIYVLGSYMVSGGFAAPAGTPSAYNIIARLQANPGLLRLTGGIVQALSLVGLLRTVGKKAM